MAAITPRKWLKILSSGKDIEQMDFYAIPARHSRRRPRSQSRKRPRPLSRVWTRPLSPKRPRSLSPEHPRSPFPERPRSLSPEHPRFLSEQLRSLSPEDSRAQSPQSPRSQALKENSPIIAERELLSRTRQPFGSKTDGRQRRESDRRLLEATPSRPVVPIRPISRTSDTQQLVPYSKAFRSGPPHASVSIDPALVSPPWRQEPLLFWPSSANSLRRQKTGADRGSRMELVHVKNTDTEAWRIPDIGKVGPQKGLAPQIPQESWALVRTTDKIFNEEAYLMEMPETLDFGDSSEEDSHHITPPKARNAETGSEPSREIDQLSRSSIEGGRDAFASDDDHSGGLEEEEPTGLRPGKTRIPSNLVSLLALHELGYSFKIQVRLERKTGQWFRLTFD